MTQEEKYNEALRKAKEIINDPNASSVWKEWLCNCFPELAESEDEKIKDERIRKALIDGFTVMKESKNCGKTFSNHNIPVADIIAWLERQGEQKQLYIRFGEIPTDEKSKIYRGEIEVGTENGVSVYPAFKTDEGDIVLGLSLPITKTTLYTQQHLIEYDNRPCYLVNGNYIGKDTDGQPLLNNVSIIKKIDNYRVKEEKQGEQEKDILEDAILDGNEDGLIAETIRYKNEKQSKQKPVWSEEDERLCQCLIEDQKEALDIVHNDKYGHSEIISDLKEMYHERIDWLKSLKERIGR